MRIYCENWKRKIREPEGGWIVRFPGTPGQAGNNDRSKKSGMFFVARKTSVSSPQFTHDFISPKNQVLHPVFTQNPVQKATRSRQIINPQKSTTDPITIAQ